MHVNAADHHQQTVAKCKQVIYNHYYIMKNKHISHDHVKYIIDKVILPKLEYLLQHTILTYKQCQTLMAPLKRLFKQRFHLPLNIADNIIFNHFFPYIDNLFDIQIKSQLNILSALFNTPLLCPITLQKLYHLQYELWFPTIPTNISQYISDVLHPSYLAKSLALISNYNFHLDLTLDIMIKDGCTPICVYISNLFTSDLKSLRTKNIMFINQLVSSDGNYLLT